MKISTSRLREIIKEELKSYKIPYSIGYNKREDFKHGLVKKMFEFFYTQGRNAGDKFLGIGRFWGTQHFAYNSSFDHPAILHHTNLVCNRGN